MFALLAQGRKRRSTWDAEKYAGRFTVMPVASNKYWTFARNCKVLLVSWQPLTYVQNRNGVVSPEPSLIFICSVGRTVLAELLEIRKFIIILFLDASSNISKWESKRSRSKCYAWSGLANNSMTNRRGRRTKLASLPHFFVFVSGRSSNFFQQPAAETKSTVPTPVAQQWDRDINVGPIQLWT